MGLSVGLNLTPRNNLGATSSSSPVTNSDHRVLLTSSCRSLKSRHFPRQLEALTPHTGLEPNMRLSLQDRELPGRKTREGGLLNGSAEAFPSQRTLASSLISPARKSLSLGYLRSCQSPMQTPESGSIKGILRDGNNWCPGKMGGINFTLPTKHNAGEMRASLFPAIKWCGNSVRLARTVIQRSV